MRNRKKIKDLKKKFSKQISIFSFCGMKLDSFKNIMLNFKNESLI